MKTNTAKKTATKNIEAKTSTVEKLRKKLVKKSDLVKPDVKSAAPSKKLGKKTKSEKVESKSLITDKKLREKLAGLGIEALNVKGDFKLLIGGVEKSGDDFWSFTADDSKTIITSATVLGEHIENMIEKALELEKEAA